MTLHPRRKFCSWLSKFWPEYEALNQTRLLKKAVPTLQLQEGNGRNEDSYIPRQILVQRGARKCRLALRFRRGSRSQLHLEISFNT
jgi:hypothetical protein